MTLFDRLRFVLLGTDTEPVEFGVGLASVLTGLYMLVIHPGPIPPLPACLSPEEIWWGLSMIAMGAVGVACLLYCDKRVRRGMAVVVGAYWLAIAIYAWTAPGVHFDYIPSLAVAMCLSQLWVHLTIGTQPWTS